MTSIAPLTKLQILLGLWIFYTLATHSQYLPPAAVNTMLLIKSKGNGFLYKTLKGLLLTVWDTNYIIVCSISHRVGIIWLFMRYNLRPVWHRCNISQAGNRFGVSKNFTLLCCFVSFTIFYRKLCWGVIYRCGTDEFAVFCEENCISNTYTHSCRRRITIRCEFCDIIIEFW